jgi:hypothetical protein
MVPDYTNLSKSFFSAHSNEFDLSTNEGCGKYTEAFVKYARGVDTKVGHLKKSPGQTQYNGHANDAVLYPVGNDANDYHAVDIIARAEQPKPWYPDSDRQPPEGQWSEDKNTAYKSSDWMAEPGAPQPSNMVPWVAYDENSFQGLKQQLAYDYGRRPQGADFDVSVWSARVFHSTYMGPNKTPLGMSAAVHKHRPEWCAALGVPVDDTWFV